MDFPQTPAPHEHASMSLKVLLLVFALALVSALTYLVVSQNRTTIDDTSTAATVKKTATATTSPTATVDETAGWKTYTGAYFNFKYPPDWQLVTTGLGDQNLMSRLISPETQKKLKVGEVCTEICLQQIDFYYYDKVANERENKSNNYGATTLDELVTKSTTFTKIGPITINDVVGYDGIRAGLATYYQIYLSKSGHLYEIFFNHRNEKSNVSSTESLIIKSYKISN